MRIDSTDPATTSLNFVTGDCIISSCSIDSTRIPYMYDDVVLFDSAGETVALVLHDGLGALLDVEQRLE